MKDAFLYNEDNLPIFRIVTESKNGESGVDFAVYEVMSWGDDNEPADERLYLKAYMKWDGCNHFRFGEEEGGKQDGYLHLDGGDALRNHIRLMRFLSNYAFHVMGREPFFAEDKLDFKPEF
jgi:hypothetical protein